MNKSLSITAANGLYLLAMILVASLGAWLRSLSFSWGLLATEIFCILLPALLFLRLKGGPGALRSLRALNPVGWKLTLVGLMLGLGAWLVGSFIDALMAALVPSVASAASAAVAARSLAALPTTPWGALLLFIAMAVAAPLCEEVLFRGGIQPAYERYGAAAGAVIASLLFAFFHLSLVGLAGLLPAAFILGYTYYRTRSLGAAVAVHFANNALAAGVIILAGLFPEQSERVLRLPSFTSAGFGVVLLLAGLILLSRLTPRPKVRPEKPRAGLVAWLLLALALGLFAGVVGLSGEVAAFRGGLLSLNLEISALHTVIPPPYEMVIQNLP
jgi:membrane protease YdiL (CAAX protease family)